MLKLLIQGGNMFKKFCSYYKPHSIYSTKAARLASTVGQIKLEQNQLEAAIAELSQTGQDLQQHCKNV